MKRIIFVSLALVATGFLFLFSRTFGNDVSSVVNANNQFALDLYSKYKSKEGNIFFSPYSISSAMAMTYEGAKGKTAEEIQSVFHFPKDDSLRRGSFLEVNSQINKKDKKYELHTANALWAQKDCQFLESYFKLIENYYGGKATNLDFIKDAEEPRITVNNWVGQQTNEKIKDLIPPGSIDRLTRLVLTNAVYFKGLWLKQFDKKATEDKDFKVRPGGTIKIPMMIKGAEFNYAETDQLKILELPYEGNELSMLIFLPIGDDLEVLENSLTVEKLSEWKKLLRREEVIVCLPKFRFENKYFMKDTLKEMGMPTAFTDPIDFGGNADFSGMTGKSNLCISQVIHQAFVDVNEEGTEAAAATAVLMRTQSAGGELRVSKIFNADHPFIFIIQEEETGNILFVGRVNNPTK